MGFFFKTIGKATGSMRLLFSFSPGKGLPEEKGREGVRLGKIKGTNLSL